MISEIKHVYFGIALVLCLSGLQLFLNYSNFRDGVGGRDLAASYHVLLTIEAFRGGNPAEYFYLPSVSLPKGEKTPWGLTQRAPSGDYIYTSFTTAGFWLPFFVFEIFDVETNIHNLAILNWALGLLVSLLLYIFLYFLFFMLGASKNIALVAALCGVSVSVFSTEAFTSHGLIYWAQSLYQLVFVLQLLSLLLFLFYLKNRQAPGSFYWLYASPLLFLTFLGPYIEWTGFIFNLGLITALWLCFGNNKEVRYLIIGVFGATFLSGLLILGHFSLVLDFNSWVEVLKGRAQSRYFFSPEEGISDLLEGYRVSFGYFLVFLGAFLMLWFQKWRGAVRVGLEEKIWIPQSSMKFFLIVAAVPLLENLILLQHAVEFRFDRLKLLFLLSILIAYLIAAINKRMVQALVVLVCMMASIVGFGKYQKDLKFSQEWENTHENNMKLKMAVERQIKDKKCAVFVASSVIRGYHNFLFQRNIHEWNLFPDLNKEDCILVYLFEADVSLRGIFYNRVWFIKNNSPTLSDLIHKDGRFQITETENPRIFPITDSDWFQGFQKGGNQFIVNPMFRSSVNVGDRFMIAGSERVILSVNKIGRYWRARFSGGLIEEKTLQENEIIWLN